MMDSRFCVDLLVDKTVLNDCALSEFGCFGKWHLGAGAC
jgi:hypothetical protein